MQPIVVVPFASKAHGEEYYLGVFELLKRHLVKHGVEVHNKIVTETEEAEYAGKKYSDFLPIAMVLTGGTSSNIEVFASNGHFERVILFSHSEHNSLASAVSAKNKIERRGVIGLIYHCSDIDGVECGMVIDRMVKIAKAVATIVRSRIGLVVDRTVKNDIEEAFESRFNATLCIKPFDDLLNEMKKFDQDKVSNTVEYIAKTLDVKLVGEAVEAIARLYLALKSFIHSEKLDAVAVDCFPFILRQRVTPCIPLALLNAEGFVAGCEADLPALLGLIVSKAITDKSGWIANIVDVRSTRCILAHCTIALDIVRNVKVVPHFETETPYSLSGEYAGDTVTLLSVDRDFSIATMARGKVEASGDIGFAACRSQMVVELEYPASYIINVAPNNHHIVMAGEHRKTLAELFYLLGIDVVDYKEFWVPGYE